MVIAGVSCTTALDVQTAAAPDGTLSGRQSFRLMPEAQLRGREPLQDYDPMLPNSVTNAAIREEIRLALEKRGYHYAPDAADMDVAYYATTAPRLELVNFDYGYSWVDLPPDGIGASQFDKGTVIIDVVSPATHRALWRGLYKGSVDPNPPDYVKEVRKAVNVIVGRFPAPSR